MTSIDRRLSIAPMMTHTDRHFRYFLRLVCRHALLYTEMLTTGALIHGDSRKLLAYNASEHPLAIQLGGSDPKQLALCASMAQDAGYDEVNLNVGCPSDRVQSGKFGACLMAEPELVAACVAAMQASVSIPVTVKTRIGIDDQDNYQHLYDFVVKVSDSGCQTFIIHARKAWLQGLSPRQNREVPPLNYQLVHRLKHDFPALSILINGGFTTLAQVKEQLQHVDGVMMGRAICNNPYLLAQADQVVFGDTGPVPSRHDVMQQFIHYIEQEMRKGVSFSRMTRHILGMFYGQGGARAFRRYLSENIYQTNTGVEVIEQAMSLVKAA